MTIEDWVYRHFTETTPTNTGSDLIVHCPFCTRRIGSPDLSGHLYISILDEVCHCFRCGYASSWIKLIADATGVSYIDARRELAESNMMPLYLLRRRAQPETKEVMDLPESFVTIKDALLSDTAMLMQFGTVARSYVQFRIGSLVLNWQKYLDKWGVWDSADGYGKLVLPVERGWWQERIISDGGPKYLSKHAPKEDRLYNWQALGSDRVYITEGIFSAAALGQAAVALCGKEATPEQLRRLGLSKTGSYIVCLDSDAKRESLALAKQLHSYGKDVYVRWYEHGDPANMGEYSEELFSWKSNVAMALR